jgi:integrase
MKRKRASKSPKSIEVTEGSVVVTITSERNRVGKKNYWRHNLVYFEGGQRVRRRFSDLEKAKAEAEVVAIKLSNREGEVLKLAPADRAHYLQACEILAHHNPELRLNLAVSEYVEADKLVRPFGIKLGQAAAEYADVRSMLPSGTSLKTVVTEWRARHQQVREQKMVSDLVDEFIAAKEKIHSSHRHVRDLKHRLGRFAKSFNSSVAELTGPMLQTYIDGRGVGARSKLNEFRHVKSVLRFAVKRKYAPRDLLDELEAVEKPKARVNPTLVFTPADLREILAALVEHRPDLIPAIVIAAFCGLRTAEIQRLDWREVRLTQGCVEVPAIKSKTASRRVVPLCDAACSWLMPYAKKEGLVCPVTGENRLYEAVLSALRKSRTERKVDTTFRWVRNGFRHGFCSHRLMLTKDQNLVALEAGNSPSMLHANYKELVSESDAKEWFGIMPPRGYGANIVPMPAAVG